ncbi:MAG: hypothetical protein ABF370_04680 [Verrucomicrobiales bacterium]
MITVPKVEAPILAQRFVNHDPHIFIKGLGNNVSIIGRGKGLPGFTELWISP